MMKQEIAADCAEVSLGKIHEFSGVRVFPNGLLVESVSGDFNYTEEAQDIFNELYGIYEDIVDEHIN